MDYQECLEQCGIRAISVDIIFDLQYGDLCRGESFDLFRAALEQNVLQGVLAGPPCETWSKARGVELQDGTIGSSAPGLFDLMSTHTDCHVFLERRVYRWPSAVCCFRWQSAFWWLHWCMGRRASSSILQSSIRNRIWYLSGRRTSYAPYFVFLAVASFWFCKVTTVPNPRSRPICSWSMARFCCARSTCLPTGVSIGKDENNKSKTGELKAYTPAFCSAFAKISEASQHSPSSDEAVPSWFEEIVAEMTSGFDHRATMGDDFGNRFDACLINN